ncbi:hypothetical protein [Agrobacterium larrymoorei]|uniref:Uncharacterized protein n=1 Tax=Agrobacterium larrymoorei TaxID=160699 RepID=A0AAF0KD74_9HYPH|nr:hypothetical protein [Agrobacterium larrymoorei]WHA40915.1 hypothetical protein CFBP5477_014055 [Agrobacterium larrymoorei]
MATYSKTKTYTVKLARSIKHSGFTYKPLNEIEMKGTLLLAIIEAEGEEVIDYARLA